jgi:hypothetical protein
LRIYLITMARGFFVKLLFCLFASQAVVAFVPGHASRPALIVKLEAAKNSELLSDKVTKFLLTTAAVIATSPLVALAEEVDDYEYGAVNAPIGIAVAGGCLAILTALLPVLMQGGEEAFEEMKEKDAGKWGSGNSDALKRKK